LNGIGLQGGEPLPVSLRKRRLHQLRPPESIRQGQLATGL
jgi:hypothetical protein